MVNIQKVAGGVFFFIIGWVATVVGYYVFPLLANYIDDPIIKGIVWIGIISIWIMMLIVMPVSLILQGVKE